MPGSGAICSSGYLGDLEVATQCFSQSLLALAIEPSHQTVGGEHGQAGILQGDEAHEDVAVLSLAAQLLGVGVGGLIAMMAVGDQELGVAGGRLHRGDSRRVAQAPQPVGGAVRVCDLAPGGLFGCGLQRLPGHVVGSE